MPKLEKQNRQSGSSSFCSCLTDVIKKATFASCCLQVIGNLRFASPLFGQVCNVKLFKASSHTQVCLATVFGPLGGFLTSNLWRLPESKRSEYSVIPTCIIPALRSNCRPRILVLIQPSHGCIYNCHNNSHNQFYHQMPSYIWSMLKLFDVNN